MSLTIQDRAMGAIVGAFIGDAIALGPHWYYDLDELHRDYGTWIDDYTAPKKGRYHENEKAGDLSQSGYILKLMIRSIIDKGEYNQVDFCKKLDEELLCEIDGTPNSGPGGYTSQSIREIYRQRIKQNLSWNEVGSITVAFGAVLAQLIQGEKFDSNISSKLMKLVKDGELPFHAVTSDNLQPPKPGSKDPSNVGLFASPDALLTPSFIAQTANDPNIKIEPAWKVSLVYGMPCAIYHIVPASYYLASRFNNDFESAVLHALNGGGQNQARSILTGALVGAQVGINNIPERFLDGLNEKKEILALASKLSELI
jgi:ADP-ribosylglycohydrolase